MTSHTTHRRSVLQALAAAGGAGALSSPVAAAEGGSGLSAGESPITDPHTKATFSAVVDAVVPRTPELRDLGPEHIPGGLAIGLDDYTVTFINNLISFGLPRLGNLRLAEIVAALLDVGATKLIALGENEEPPELTRVLDLLDVGELATDSLFSLASGDAEGVLETALEGPFAKLSRKDRLRALAMLDAIEFDTAELPGPLVEADAGLIPQLIVAFTEVVYYSEWQGYEDFTAPPGERGFTNDPSAIQSWRQTDYPRVAEGYAALRGYWGTPESPLGEGETWKDVDVVEDPVEITFESGQFRENDYSTDDYQEVVPERGRGDGEGLAGDVSDTITGEVDTDREEASLGGFIDGVTGTDIEGGFAGEGF